MEIKANNYEPNDILKFMRQATDLTQKDFAKSINKSKVDWQERAVGHLGKIDKAKSRKAS